MKAPLLSVGIALAAFLPANAMAEDFWIKLDGQDCKAWTDEAPKSDETASWTGDCKEGRAAGGGMLEWRSGGKLVGTYEGEMSGGRLNGRGVLRLTGKDGGFEQLEAYFKDGEIDGAGAYEDSDGNIYEGDLKDGKPDGTGYANIAGEEYAGTFEKGRREGVGLLVSEEETYLGEFVGNVAEGAGILDDTEGGRYHGQFKNGEPHGFGTYVAGSGAVYQGRFVDGEADGHFLVTEAPGSEPVVQIFKNGELVK